MRFFLIHAVVLLNTVINECADRVAMGSARQFFSACSAPCHNFKIATFRFPFIEVFSAFSTRTRRVLGMRDTKDTFLNFSRSFLPLICVIILSFTFIFVENGRFSCVTFMTFSYARIIMRRTARFKLRLFSISRAQETLQIMQFIILFSSFAPHIPHVSSGGTRAAASRRLRAKQNTHKLKATVDKSYCSGNTKTNKNDFVKIITRSEICAVCVPNETTFGERFTTRDQKIIGSQKRSMIM